MRSKFMALLCLLSAVVLVSGACTSRPKVNAPPTAVIVASPLSGDPGVEVLFSGLLSSDVGGLIAGYAWDFGDGNTSTDPEPSNIYVAEGYYTVTLTVTDNGGAKDTATENIIVGNPDLPPTA
jgi:PKD repeat protein